MRLIRYIKNKLTNKSHNKNEKNFLSVVLASSLEAIICLEENQNITHFNSTAEDLFQYKENEVVGDKVDILIIPGKMDYYHHTLDSILENKSKNCSKVLLNGEKIFQKRDGTIFFCDISIGCLDDKDAKYIVLHIRDITQTKKRQQELVKNKERLELALESANIGLWDQNFKTGEVYRSRQWAQMLGYEPKEINTKATSWLNLVHPEDLPKVKQAANEHETGKTDTFKVEHRLKTKDGNYKWILNWGKIVEYDKDGKPVRALGTHINIHNRKVTEEKLKYLNETKNRLFSIIGHDLKNPLSDIIGFSELLRINFHKYPSEKVEKFHELIFSSAKTTQNLLDNLLQWSRFHSGELLFKPEYFNLEEIITNCFILFKSKAESKEIDLRSEITTPIEVYADKRMIETVLRNLISNAIKYTHKGGDIKLYSATQKDKIIVVVEDTGIGIKNEDAENLFAKDSQLSLNGTTGEKGTGLGLIICKDFIDKHNERIWVESEHGKGSAFKFTLPEKKKENKI